MTEEIMAEETAKITFKSTRKRNLRQRAKSSDDEDEDVADSTQQDNFAAKLSETKERQKLRNKPHGVNVIGLALGKKITIEDELTNRDPFNGKMGGMMNMSKLNAAGGKNAIRPLEDPYEVGIGTQFSAETNKRDEDEEMMKYIEDQLSKRKRGINIRGGGGGENEDGDDPADAIKYLSPEEAALLALPDHLRLGSAQRSEEMLSNQMLNGIPEVDLGIEAKIRNIEATEAAKEKLLADQKNKADGPSHFVPTNMAVNFMQHNRFNIENAEMKKRRLRQQEEHQREKSAAAAAAGHGGNNNNNTTGTGGGVKKATDDYHYDKFKKQFRRY